MKLTCFIRRFVRHYIVQVDLDSIPSTKSSDCRNYIVPEFNDYVKDLHSVARSDYVVWRDTGKPRSGTPCSM